MVRLIPFPLTNGSWVTKMHLWNTAFLIIRNIYAPETGFMKTVIGAVWNSFIRPALSTVHLPLREMGLKAAEVMIHILEHEPVPDDERGILLPCTLVPRSSIRENPME